MFAILHALVIFVADIFKSRRMLEAENLFLRHQLNIALRRAPPRFRLRRSDRALVVWMTRIWPICAIWPSRRPSCGGIALGSKHSGVGFEVAQSTVARYMCRHARPPSQGWRTFLSNHADGIAAVDLFVLPTIAFRILYCLVIMRHGRRFWVSFGVTANPTAAWISGQITEAFPWDHAPQYLFRDRDTSYGPGFVQRLRAMGIRDRPIAFRSPWQNPYVERLIGSIRRECLDHMIFGAAHLRRVLGAYAAYYLL